MQTTPFLLCYQVAKARADWYDTTGELKLVLKIDKIIQFEPTELANGRRPSIAAYHPLPLVSSMAILIFLLALSQ